MQASLPQRLCVYISHKYCSIEKYIPVYSDAPKNEEIKNLFFPTCHASNCVESIQKTIKNEKCAQKRWKSGRKTHRSTHLNYVVVVLVLDSIRFFAVAVVNNWKESGRSLIKHSLCSVCCSSSVEKRFISYLLSFSIPILDSMFLFGLRFRLLSFGAQSK